MAKPKLHRQICAFIDVLGGGKLFRGRDRKRAETFFLCLTEFERRLNGWSHHFPKKRQSSALVKTFSDNIFVAFPFASNPDLDDEEVVLRFLVELRQQLYEMTLLAGFPVRGGVAVGPLMFTEKFLFGPALVDAVDLEKAAVFPRILLGDSVLRLMPADGPAAQWALKDADGKVFLDYLGGSFLAKSVLERHQDYVRSGLQENSAQVRERQKYEWLAQYHNHVARKEGCLDLLVDVERPAAFTALL